VPTGAKHGTVPLMVRGQAPASVSTIVNQAPAAASTLATADAAHRRVARGIPWC